MYQSLSFLIRISPKEIRLQFQFFSSFLGQKCALAYRDSQETRNRWKCYAHTSKESMHQHRTTFAPSHLKRHPTAWAYAKSPSTRSGVRIDHQKNSFRNDAGPINFVDSFELVEAFFAKRPNLSVHVSETDIKTRFLSAYLASVRSQAGILCTLL